MAIDKSKSAPNVEQKVFRRDFNFARYLDFLGSRNYIDSNVVILLVSDEITLDPRCDEILTKANQCVSLNITTTEALYNKKSQAAQQDSATLLVSVDSGTRETYKRIKGVDTFEKVCETLKKYGAGSANCNIVLKYIRTADNLNDDDLQGFMALASSVSAKSIVLSQDIYEDSENLCDEYIEFDNKFIIAAEKLGVSVECWHK